MIQHNRIQGIAMHIWYGNRRLELISGEMSRCILVQFVEMERFAVVYLYPFLVL